MSVDSLLGQTLLIDGYNVLTTAETALAGGFILAARDGFYRDMASVHGTWRRVNETVPAVELIGQFLENRVDGCLWYLTGPSRTAAGSNGFCWMSPPDVAHWDVELVADPDRVLTAASGPIATADSAILDHCTMW